MQLISVNPELLITRLNNKYFAWIPGFDKPMGLAVQDILLLQTFLPGRGISPLLPPDLLPPIHKMLARADPILLRSFINRFIDKGILIESDSNKALERLVKGRQMEFQPAADIEQFPPENVKLRISFSLRPGTAGFVVWGIRKRSFFTIQPVYLYLLLRIKSKLSPGHLLDMQDEGITKACLQLFYYWCIETDSLIAESPGKISSPGKNAGESRPSGSVCKITHTSRIAWNDIAPDNRIPVYLVSHSRSHFPTALGMISAHAKSYNHGELNKTFHFLPLVYMEPRDYLDQVYKRFGPGIWMFSNYMWSIDFNQKLSEICKSLDKNNITIHGGPSTPKYTDACKEFMQKNLHVDIAIRGEGENAAVHVLECLANNRGRDPSRMLDGLEDVPGITFAPGRDNTGELFRTPDRHREADIDIFPSPYLTGEFCHYGANIVAATIETNRGCPFGCTFCDWGSATLGKIRRFDMKRVLGEIEYVGREGIKVIWIADANFGIFDRDIEIAEYIAETNRKYGFPSEVVVNYTKNATKRLAEIIRIFSNQNITAQGIISIQSTDRQTLKDINRSNIKTSVYNDLAQIFRQEKLPLSTDLMYGLPGMTVNSFKNDLQYFFDRDVSVKAYPTQLLPNSPMADPEYMDQYQIRVDDNGFLKSTYSYTEPEYREMQSIFCLYDILDGHSLLRCVLRFLQWEHNIRPVDFIQQLVQVIHKDPARLPITSWLFKFFRVILRVPGGWWLFYDEIARYATDEFSVVNDSAFNAILRANEMLLPEETRSYPSMTKLEHDVVAYFHDHTGNHTEKKPLQDYPPGLINVEDPYNYSRIDFSDVTSYDNHQVFWELTSPISRQHSSPNFIQLRSST